MTAPASGGVSPFATFPGASQRTVKHPINEGQRLMITPYLQQRLAARQSLSRYNTCGRCLMSTASKRLLSPEEYLAQERLADFKSEYLRGEVFAMAGATYEHTLIKDNMAREAGTQLKNGPCRVLTSDMRVKVNATGLYTYPDIVIVCDEPQFEDKVLDTLLNPRAL